VLDPAVRPAVHPIADVGREAEVGRRVEDSRRETSPWLRRALSLAKTRPAAKWLICRLESGEPNGRGLETGALCTAPALEPTWEHPHLTRRRAAR
jgi:hypothetical protein